ncbi:MAG: amidohydrolase family protein, partial [Anaerolineae bacterium]
AETYEDALIYCRRFIERWNGHPLIQPAVAPHAWYTGTPEMLRACADLARAFDVPIHTHISETKFEVQNCRELHNMPVVPWNMKNGILDTKLLAAHCVHLDRGEMYDLHKAGAGVAHCPTSNLKLSSGIAAVGQMLEMGLNVGVGTDGPASNNDLDMFEEVRLAALLAKTQSGDPTVLPARQALEAATIGGARAMHMADITGSLEPGKRADIAIVDMDGVHNQPHFNHNPDAVYSRLIYAAKSTDVAHVMCNGRWLMQDRQLLTVDEAAAKADAAQVAIQIDAFVQEREASPYNKLVLLSGVQRQESFEVQVKVPIEDDASVLTALKSDQLEIVKQAHYKQYDQYFMFDRHDPDAPNAVMLSRSRFLAEADRTLRFYREYFDPKVEVEVNKERRRWRVLYQGTDFAINLDKLTLPAMEGYYLEIKSRTWSRSDAGRKANLMTELLAFLGADPATAERKEYPVLALADA